MYIPYRKKGKIDVNEKGSRTQPDYSLKTCLPDLVE